MPSQPIRLHAPLHLPYGSDPLFPFAAQLITPTLNAGTVDLGVFGVRKSGELLTWPLQAGPSPPGIPAFQMLVGYMTIQLLTPGVTPGYVITNFPPAGLPGTPLIAVTAYNLVGQGVTQQQATGNVWPAFIDAGGNLWTYAAGIGSARAPISSVFPFAYAAGDILFMGSLNFPGFGA